jgi:acetyl esterase/lipase
VAPSLKNLAPALILTAEMDPLRDEGAAYAERLRAEGNKVEYKMYKGMPHHFMHLDGILEAAKQYNLDSIVALKAALWE